MDKPELPDTLFESFGFCPEQNHCLNMGAPGPNTLREAADLMLKGCNVRLQQEVLNKGALMQYGPQNGDPMFLQCLADFLAHEYLSPVKVDHLIVTGGATSGLYFLLSLLFPSNVCPFFVEELTYHIAITVVEQQMKFPLVSVSLEEDGLNLEKLEESFKANQSRFVFSDSHPFGAVLYLVPTFHNPTGYTLSASKRQLIVKLAQQYKVLVVCDDVYDMLWYTEDRPPPRLFAYDQECVISNGTLSKLLGPGLRLGWLEAPIWFRKLWEKSGVALSGGSLNHFTSGVVASVLPDMSKFLVELRRKYSESLLMATEMLTARLVPLGCSFFKSSGGYFIWLKLPKSADAMAFHKFAREKYNVMIQEGSKFASDPARKQQFSSFVRLAFSYYDGARLQEAFSRFCSSVEDYLETIQ